MADELLTNDDLRAILRTVIDRAGGIAQAAAALGVTRPAIYNILDGTFSIGTNVAQALGYRRVIRYERIDQARPS